MKRTLENDTGLGVAREENFNASLAFIRCKYNLNRYKLEVVSVFWVLIPSTDVIQLTLILETLVTVNDNSPIQDYIHPDNQTQPTFDMFWVLLEIEINESQSRGAMSHKSSTM